MKSLRTLIADLSGVAGRPVDLVARVDADGNVDLIAEWRWGANKVSRRRTIPGSVVSMDPPPGALESLLVHDVMRFVERSA